MAFGISDAMYRASSGCARRLISSAGTVTAGSTARTSVSRHTRLSASPTSGVPVCRLIFATNARIAGSRSCSACASVSASKNKRA